MIQEIKYNGFTANPSDYESADGELATAIGLVPEDGALKPVLPPKPVMQLGQGRRVAFIHKTADFKNYIIHKDRGNVHFTNDDRQQQGLPMVEVWMVPNQTEIHSFSAVGNTLVILASDGIHYFLWKADTGTYLDLGTHIPECPISFGLQGDLRTSEKFKVYFDKIGGGDIFNEFSDNNKRRVTEQVLAKVNKFIAEESTEKGKFLYPFFVRYAYRLYDGTLTMHSSPVLMVASSDLAPQVYWNYIQGEGEYTEAQCFVMGVLHTLDYKVCDRTARARLMEWKDIVRSIDFFVSAPIYTYDQNGECDRFANSSDVDTYSVCRLQSCEGVTMNYRYSTLYQKRTYNEMYAMAKDPSGFTYPTGRVMLPRKSVDEVKEDIRSCSQFYFLKSVKLENLHSGLGRETIEVEEDYLKTLTTREAMTDDYDSHDTIIPRYAFAYNARLNVANIKKELYNAYNTGALFQYTDGYVGISGGKPDTSMDGTQPYTVYFYIKQDGRDIVVQGTSFSLSQFYPSLLFLYYPNINAYKAVVIASAYQRYELKLEQHDFLNGAFYFGGWNEPPQTGETPLTSTDEQRTVNVPNKIYTSEVNNPFYFPVLGINTVGTGEILGISAAAKALSQGQFGQFPLYAFSTDGVWALEVSSTGTYSAKQPITRDVCINTDSITQMDSAVLFATDRGIMLISGSETACLSDSINSRDLFALSDLPKADKLVSLFNERAGEGEQITLENSSLLPFRDFLTACKMVYDYTNQRIIVYNPYVSYAYVYSLKSKSWGMMRSDITDSVNAYPDALATNSAGKLVNLSLSDAEGITALAVTRPFKLGYPDVLKTIDTVIQRGYFQAGHVAQVLYGSRDLSNWHIVWSSTDKYLRGFRGSPYKYFRLALICKLGKAECIDGCTVQFTPRLTNKPR